MAAVTLSLHASWQTLGAVVAFVYALGAGILGFERLPGHETPRGYQYTTMENLGGTIALASIVVAVLSVAWFLATLAGWNL